MHRGSGICHPNGMTLASWLLLTPLRFRRCCSYICLSFCCLAAKAFTEVKPLSTQYLECVQDDKGANVVSRSLPTPVFDSQQGFRAYGVVVASQFPKGGCENTTTVYLADPGRTFRVVFQQRAERLPDGSVYDGNGIINLLWSPSGTRLLIEVSQWTWGTDSTWNTKYVLFTSETGEVTELPITAAIQRHFSKPCGWMDSSEGWLDDEQIAIELKPSPDVDEEGDVGPTPSCVDKATQFSFDVNFGEFSQLVKITGLDIENSTRVEPEVSS